MMKTSNPLMGPLGVSLAAIAIILILLAVELPPLVSSTGTAAGSGAPKQDKVNHLVDAHELALATDRERFNGRSFFFRPPSPPRPKPKIEKPKVVPNLPAPPPKVEPKPVEPVHPKTYIGPDLQAIVGPTAFFRPSSGGLIVVNVGETEQEIELLNTNAPHDIEVKYKGGGPYSVTLFEMAEPDFLSNEIDVNTSAENIILETRDAPDVEPLLEGQSGWPVGTIAGDTVRILYRKGPYEAAVTGMLRRANRAWLVMNIEGSDTPIEIFKADVISVQNLNPRPPEPEPEPEVSTESLANNNASGLPTVNENASSLPAANDNASGLPITNDNGTIQFANDNSSAPITGGANGNATSPANANASIPEAVTPPPGDTDDPPVSTEDDAVPDSPEDG